MHAQNTNNIWVGAKMAKSDDLAVGPLWINLILEHPKDFLKNNNLLCLTVLRLSHKAVRISLEFLNHFVAPPNLGIKISAVVRFFTRLSRPRHRIRSSDLNWTHARFAEKRYFSSQFREFDCEPNLAQVFEASDKRFVLFHSVKSNFQRSILSYHRWIWYGRLYIWINWA
jgi:hypothetical protein